MNATQQSDLAAELDLVIDDLTVCDFLSRVSAAVPSASLNDLERLGTAMAFARDSKYEARFRATFTGRARQLLHDLTLPGALREEGEQLLLPVA